jgi:small-conductance mechanosensitive channel
VIGIVLILTGLAAAAVGYLHFRDPWARYQALKAQDANIARYESWRGGLRDSGGTTGASVAMDILRRKVRQAAILIGAGVALAIVGLLLWK